MITPYDGKVCLVSPLIRILLYIQSNCVFILLFTVVENKGKQHVGIAAASVSKQDAFRHSIERGSSAFGSAPSPKHNHGSAKRDKMGKIRFRSQLRT